MNRNAECGMRKASRQRARETESNSRWERSWYLCAIKVEQYIEGQCSREAKMTTGHRFSGLAMKIEWIDQNPDAQDHRVSPSSSRYRFQKYFAASHPRRENQPALFLFFSISMAFMRDELTDLLVQWPRGYQKGGGIRPIRDAMTVFMCTQRKIKDFIGTKFILGSSKFQSTKIWRFFFIFILIEGLRDRIKLPE